MILNELRDRAYKCACEHGFHEEERPDEHSLMLAIGEVSEMVEADRNNNYPDVDAFTKSDIINDCDFYDKFERFIKDTVWDECADVAIRMFSFAGEKKYNLPDDSYKSFDGIAIENVDLTIIGYAACAILADSSIQTIEKVKSVIVLMYKIADSRNVNLSWFIQQKMRYNEMRPYKNGKRY